MVKLAKAFEKEGVGRRGQILGQAIGARNWDGPEGRAFLRHRLALP